MAVILCLKSLTDTMQYTPKYLNGEQIFLEIAESDLCTFQESIQVEDEKNIAISLSNIMQIKLFPNVERLIITSGYAPDIIADVLESLPRLRELKLDYDETEPFTKWCIDISRLSNLEYLFSRSSYNFKGVCNSKSLKTLIVQNWYSEDLALLKSSSIDTLSIGCGKLRTLAGLENAPLKILSLSYLPRLVNISQVKETSLIILEIDNCNKISGIEDFLPSTLEYLMFYGKNKVGSGTFIKKSKSLKRVMLDISIEDGDLSAFDSLESAVILTDRRYYNRKNIQLPKSESQFTISSIPQWRYLYSRRRI